MHRRRPLIGLVAAVLTGGLGIGCAPGPPQTVGPTTPPATRPAARTPAELLALMIHGGRIACVSHDARIVALRFEEIGGIDGYSPWTDTLLDRLPDLPAVEEVYFRAMDVTEAGVLAAIRKFPRLKVVVLTGASITGEGVPVPATAPDLKIVYVPSLDPRSADHDINAALKAQTKAGPTEVKWWSKFAGD